TVESPEKWKSQPNPKATGLCAQSLMSKTSPIGSGDEGIVWPCLTISAGSCTTSTPDSQCCSRKTLLPSGNPSGSRDLSAQLLSHFIDQPVQIFVGLPSDVNLVDGMQHRGVMLAAKLATDLRQGSFGEMLGQVHGDLPGIDNGARVVLGLDLDQAQSELLSHCLLDRLDRDLAGLGVDKILQHLLGVGQRDLGADQRRMRYQADERAFQFANVGADIGRDIERHVGGQDYLFLLRLLLQNRNLGFKVGRLDVGDQSPLEAAAQP